MSIYKKLQEARVRLQKVKMNKSGHNKFAGYSYFELSDFLPHINEIFNDVGLCGVVSFSAELAELWIYETEGEGKIVFTSPMADANLKGCHPIQNLGAVQSYQRRYLWLSALEIVEHDAIDSSDKVEPIDYAKQLNSAVNINDLVSIWQTIPKKEQAKYANIKNAVKARLTPVQEAA
jgi:hypothetical protein